MKEIELIGKRKAREKHFLKQNGVIEAQVFDEDIHFLKNGIYEEIDNTLINKGDYYTNKNNAYEVKLYKDTSDNLMEVSIDDKFIKTRLLNPNLSKLTENIMESKTHKNVCYSNILDNIDLEYNVLPTKVKEAIILKNKNVCIEKLVFSIETNMKLSLLENKKIIAEKDGVQIFEFDAPYMIDNEFKTNNNVFYELTECDRDKYLLKIKIDEEWLQDEDTKYPVMIDPTITNSGQNNSVYDTYIYPGDTGIDRNSQDILKAGFETKDGVKKENRTLIKFDLPTIGTGSQVISADLKLYGYPETEYNVNDDLILVHQITTEWEENTATWDSMHDKYNPLVEGLVFCKRGYYDYEHETIIPAKCDGDITRLVRKWYTGTPNYGLMLKCNDVKYNPNILPAFYSKNNNSTGVNPKPLLSISYKNQNGILDYMDYQTQNFIEGNTYVNSYNGNLTTIFSIGGTIGGKLPLGLDLVYNTNDVILNNDCGYGLGYKFSLHQVIKEQSIDGKTYLEYSDEDGTLHYFLNQKTVFNDNGYNTTNTENIYYDEDGLNMTITKDDNDYILKDKNGNTKKFIKNGNIAYLSEIKNVSGNKSIITYNSKNMITKIVDANNSEINITYKESAIVVNSPDKIVVLNYSNNKVSSITSLLGTTCFEYNERNIITKITDINGLKIIYEYYDQKPYKIKKVSHYGLENVPGEYFNVLYGFDSTTITDSKGNAKNMIFNSQGSIVSISGLKDKEDINNAYGISQINGTNDGTNPGYNNKILRTEIPLKYVKNLLTNTSFEQNVNCFQGGSYSTVTISDEEYNTGMKSLKIVTHTYDDQIIFYNGNTSFKKGKYYTFSCYVKSTNKLRLQLKYEDKNNQIIEAYSDIINPNEEFERHDVTIYYSEDANSNLFVGFNVMEIGTAYIDDIQLEEGKVTNNYNLLENSDFSNGYSDWNVSKHDINTGDDLSDTENFEIITLKNGITALKTHLNPAYAYSMEKTFSISGKGGDVFNISFWYKNQGIDSNLSESYGSRVYINFDYINQDDGHCGIPSPLLNINDEMWQYVSNDFMAEKDYRSITIGIYHEYTANDFYITNMNLFKDIRNVFYEYDEYGNIILQNDLDNKTSDLNYDGNNNLIKSVTPDGDCDTFEYDNEFSNRLLNGISDLGVSNQRVYDSNENVITTRISKNGMHGDIINGLYKIRLKGTHKYLGNISNAVKIKEEDCSHDLWKIEKVDEYFKISYGILSEKYFNVQHDMIVLADEGDDNYLFKLNKNKNGSYLIKLKTEDKYLKWTDSELEVTSLIQDDYHFEFYFETTDNKLFIEVNTDYDSEGKYIRSTTDSLLNKTVYDINSENSLINSIKTPNNNVTEYNYNDKKQIVSIMKGDMKVDYNYDSNNLRKISFGNKEYRFSYDSFLNLKAVKIGDSINLVENYYGENNDNLLSTKFGNNQIINYEYDSYGRLNKVLRMDDVFEYQYNNNGDLIKIISNNDIVKNVYSTSKKLSEYNFNKFKIKYIYDSKNNIIDTIYTLNQSNAVKKEFNSDNLICGIKFNDAQIIYNYDSLGRLDNMSIDSKFSYNYKYLTNGNRTSFVIKELVIGNDTFSYKYDKLCNITHIYKNGILQCKYYYNNYNELIKEYNHMNNEIKLYEYDNSGNILSRKVFAMNTLNLLRKDKYEYNNSFWEDQLTRFNNQTITYDEIGNPITIGDNTTLNWINGKELSSYLDKDNIVDYSYNHNGIRKSKIVNGLKTNYYLDGNDVIYEECNENTIFYIRDNNKELIGFKYNESIYYYIKNIFNDVVGILDSNGNAIAKYEYDAWGNIISIVDDNGNDISNNPEHIGNINPFRYRSYYYDKETNFYYLNTRYYNPLWGRFLSADTLLGANNDLISYNLYTYCSNNPISNCDASGKGIGSLFKAIRKTVKKLARKVVSIVKKVTSIAKVAETVKKIAAITAVKNISNKPKKQPFCPKQVAGPKTSYPDYTEELNKVLITNASKALTIKKVNPFGSMDYFYQNEKETGSPWDYKSAGPWKADIGVPYLGRDKPFVFNGYVITAEDFGNIHYGYVGYMLGFSPEVLYTGAGYQNSGISVELVKGPYYGDNKNDICSIKYGIELAKKK